MEIQGAINALLHVRHLPDDVILHTDSSYLIQGITKWVKGWLKNGWTTSTKEEVQNRDLWELLTSVLEEREYVKSEVIWKHVSGHQGVPGNERCDKIATMFADKKSVELYNGSLEEYPIDLLSSTPNREKKVVKSKSRSKEKAYSYLSMIDGKIETYKTWAECEAKVKGTKGAKYKKALSKEEEEEIIADWQK
jgi:ribonuclease HI